LVKGDAQEDKSNTLRCARRETKRRSGDGVSSRIGRR
jgi:hypothetical protein